MSHSPISSVSLFKIASQFVVDPNAVAKWLGRQSYLDDLQSLDKDLYKGLISQSAAQNATFSS